MVDSDEITPFLARLLAEGTLARTDALVTRALTDVAFRQEVDRRLKECGYVLLDNPFASHVGLGMLRSVAGAVFGREDHWVSNSLGLNKDDVSLLVILWAMLIIPKRMRQQGVDQSMHARPFQAAMARFQRSAESVAIASLLEDFGGRWKRTYLATRLAVLARHGFIVRDGERVREGPRLDLYFDYPVMMARIMDGVLENYSELIERNERRINSVPRNETRGHDEASDEDPDVQPA